jgi:hypothetical protein
MTSATSQTCSWFNLRDRNDRTHRCTGRFQSGVRSTLAGTVNPYHGLEEQLICHDSSLIADSTHGHDGRERCANVFHVSFRYKRQHERDVARLQRFARGADHRSVK